MYLNERFKKKHIGTYRDFPKIIRRDDGTVFMSTFGWFDGDAPKDYTRAFGDDEYYSGYCKLAKDLAGWQEFIAFMKASPDFSDYYDPHEVLGISRSANLNADTFSTHVEIWILDSISHIICRMIHLSNKFDFDLTLFNKVYREWETAALSRNLNFSVIIPILMVTFEEDAQPLNEDITIAKIPDKFFLAMNLHNNQESSSFKSIKNKCTHAIVWKDLSFPDLPLHQTRSAMYNRSSFISLLKSIDLFFAALRSLFDIETGYCELLCKADGWGDRWVADLPDTNAIAIRSYPSILEGYQIKERSLSLSRKDVDAIAEIWKSLESSTHNSLAVATKRLNLAYLRNTEEDSIIDIVIGLETLLVQDSGQGEISHKLASRMAILVKLFPFELYSPRKVFSICKKLYAYRSKVAHGDSKAEKHSRFLLTPQTEPIPMIKIGLTFLRYSIRIIALNPKYLTCTEIDFALNQPEAQGDMLID